MNEQNPTETRFFQELGGKRTGLVQIHAGFVKRCDFSFDARLDCPGNQPDCILLDDARVLSLHQNQLVFGGNVHAYQSGQRVSRAEVISHLALIGPDPWRADELVRRISFSCRGIDHLFMHAEKQRRIVQTNSFSEDDIRLFHVQIGGETYGADHLVSLSSNNPIPRIDDIRFWIEFADGCPLRELRQRLMGYLSFLSFLCNRRVSPYSVRMGKTLAADTTRPGHEVIWSWPDTGLQTESCPVWKAPFAGGDDEDLSAVAEGLSCWIKRVDKWEAAYLRMMACLEATEEISSERMLTAWRWFERLPDAKEENVLDAQAIAPLVDAAFAVAQQQGLDISKGRIKGSLKVLCKEGLEQRLRRLVASAMRGTDMGDIWASMVKDIVAGRDIRGAASHGNLSHSGQQGAVQRALSASATEAFCFLFTARDLPLTSARRERLRHHPLVAAYIHLLAANRTSSP